MGALELSGRELSDIIYIAGYITSSLDPLEIDDPNYPNESRAPLAAWVPYDTHRITYSSNDVIRRFSVIDNALHLSNSRRSAIGRVAGSLNYMHDTDQIRLPKKLRLYYQLPGHSYWVV
ncbi:uncharacterized protein BJX67DRAFT_367907 [Aspergillus lucknowensis]|uniref:Uncharacterized protein n=1 Tax=Aspergillus lucknowensis TaxID=176173 RepID=A0ABR4LBG9_9EURO